MIIGNDIVLNVEDFLGAMINSYLLFAPYADLSYDEIAQLLEEYFCDYIAQYGIVILKLYTKKTEKGIFIDYKYNGINGLVTNRVLMLYRFRRNISYSTLPWIVLVNGCVIK